MAVVSKHDAIVSMSASSSSSFPFGILLFGIVLFSFFWWTIASSQVYRVCPLPLSLFASLLSIRHQQKTLVVLPSVLFCL